MVDQQEIQSRKLNKEAKSVAKNDTEEQTGDDSDQLFEKGDCLKITDFLSDNRILLDLETSSRKRLFEHIAEVSTKGIDQLSEDCIFKTIAERERLGSTGLGKGVAVPHGRIADLDAPVITLARLKHPVDYDAPDNLPVWLAVSLLVPEKANDMHLKLLSTLAACFQNQDFIDAIRRCGNALEVRQLFDQFL